ncbi:MAG: DUF5362 family protein [Saprospiraceae bacterium]
MENLSPIEEKKEELFLTDFMKKELKQAANWATFISISTVLFCAMWGLNVFSSMIFSSSETLSSLTFVEIFALIILIFTTSLIIISGVGLFSFSHHLKKALKNKQAQALNISFDYLSKYFIFSSVLLIFMIIWMMMITFNPI